ncbi:MAG: MFS transporter [Gemmataceae bacterium]
MRPTRVRYGVLAFVCALSMITYLDRASFPNVQGHVLTALGKNHISELKLALTAFQLAYALFEVPTGLLGDLFGPRKTLVRIVLWWSFFIALTGLVGLRVSGFTAFGYTVGEFMLYDYAGLVVIRFLFGIGEAGAYPNIARALYNWFPLKERARASGTVWMSARLMGGLTPLITGFLLRDLGLHWRVTLMLFGGLGVVWSVAWFVWFRNRPDEKPECNAAERELIHADRGPVEVHSAVPWGKIFSHRGVWALCLMYFCTNYSWYFSMNYLPAFLENQYGLDPANKRVDVYKGGPLLLGMAGCFIGGWLSDRHIRRTGDRKWGRRLYGILGHGLAGLLMLACIVIPVAPGFAGLFALAIALSGFFNDLTMGPTWAACQDVGKRYSAIVSGCMNMIGNLGGALTTYMTGWINLQAEERYAVSHQFSVETMSKAERIVAQLPGWRLNFALYAAMYFLAVVFWMMLDVTRPVEAEKT